LILKNKKAAYPVDSANNQGDIYSEIIDKRNFKLKNEGGMGFPFTLLSKIIGSGKI